MARELIPTPSKTAQEQIGATLEATEKKWPRLFFAIAHHKTTKGEPLTFKDKPWLKAIYQDNANEMVVVKCSQVHMTEHALCAMFTLAHQGKRGMYVLPSKEHRKTFVSDRINRAKDYCSLYKKAIKAGSDESDSNVYKSIFGRGWKFVGSNVRADFFEFPCEVLFFDEYDQLDQDNLPYAYDRVANVKSPVIWKFGNPTRDDFGISKEWMLSDQKEWHVTCNKCGHEQTLDWYTHFVTPHENTWRLRSINGDPICEECHQSFDRLNHGRWIALNPGSTVSGYRISRLFVDKHKEPNDIMFLFKMFLKAQGDQSAMQAFHNNVLAVTYENVDFKITCEALRRAAYDGALVFDPALHRTVMGVDQGKMFTCTISMVWDGELIDVHYANVKRWKDVEELEEQWHVVLTCVDAQGGGYSETRDFVAAKGTRWMVYYRPKDQIKKKYNQLWEEQTIEVNRTELLDIVAKSIMDKKRRPKKTACAGTVKTSPYLAQMTASARVQDAGDRPVWTKGKDHFFHATAYNHVAYWISGMYTHSGISSYKWHADQKPVDKLKESTERIIGGVPEKPKTQTRKRWSV